jgi:alpha-tubulin suppressor-like RCC1 family protein
VTFTQFAVGSMHTCATGSDARTYCWGGGVNGGNVSTPTAVDTPPGVNLTGLTTQGFHTCGRGSNAITYCWGQNAEGELGDGTTTNRSSPTPVSAPSGVTFSKITSGQNHSCAIGDDSRTYCWGFNGSYQVGTGNTANQLTPVAVVIPGGAALTEVAASYNFTCGLGNDTRVYCWGWGWGYNLESSSPVATITMPVPFSNLSAGNTLCAQGNDNWAYCWSGNDPPGVLVTGGVPASGERMINVIWNDQMSGAVREYLAICRGCGPRMD